MNQESRKLQSHLEHTTVCERGAIGIPKQVMELMGKSLWTERKEDKAIKP